MQSKQSVLQSGDGRLRARRAVGAATLALVLTCGAASFIPQPARSQGPPPPPPGGPMGGPGGPMGGHHMGSPPTANTTMKPIEQLSSCTGCHASNLQGRQGFSPNLSKAGVLKEYNQKTFERVMNVGITNDGGHVQRPMPVYHFPKPVADKIYAYLSSIKAS